MRRKTAPIAIRWLRLLRRRRPKVTTRRSRVEDALLHDGEAPADERPLGCGWFDSSHDLREGLQVHEHASADAVAAELPLGAWLELHLVEWRGRTAA
jgi:hypothetical protein